MIDPAHDLPIQQQAEALGISRSSVYYVPRQVSGEDLWLMQRIDELHLNYPFLGDHLKTGSSSNLVKAAQGSAACFRS